MLDNIGVTALLTIQANLDRFHFLTLLVKCVEGEKKSVYKVPLSHPAVLEIVDIGTIFLVQKQSVLETTEKSRKAGPAELTWERKSKCLIYCAQCLIVKFCLYLIISLKGLSSIVTGGMGSREAVIA